MNYNVFISTEILDEIKKVLKRDFNQEGILIQRQLKLILSYTKIIKINQKIDIVKEDFDDNKIIECAVESNADYIITGDKHLLKIKNYNGIKIINSSEFIKILNKSNYHFPIQILLLHL